MPGSIPPFPRSRSRAFPQLVVDADFAATPRAAIVPFTATFTDRPVQEVVNVVCSVLNARCELRDGRVRIDR